MVYLYRYVNRNQGDAVVGKTNFESADFQLKWLPIVAGSQKSRQRALNYVNSLSSAKLSQYSKFYFSSKMKPELNVVK